MTPDDIQRERQAFEVAMVEAGYHQPDRSPFSNGQYKYERDQDRFVGWQLARALLAKQARAVQPSQPKASRTSCELLTEQDIDEIIAEGSYRNAAGGIYATSVYAFAREVAIEAVNRAIPRVNAAAQPSEAEAQRALPPAAPPPRIHGVGRIADNPCALLVMLYREPSDDDIRNVHETLAGRTATASEPAQAKVPEGYALVPVKLDSNMMNAAVPAYHSWKSRDNGGSIQALGILMWDFLLAAAPTPKVTG